MLKIKFWRIKNVLLMQVLEQGNEIKRISTHTLRGERDEETYNRIRTGNNFNSHAPWGA